MKVDLMMGLLFSFIASLFGYKWYSVWMVFFAFFPDFDLFWNEFWRTVIKREKKFSPSTVLDEYSYTHKFWFHNPLVTLPIVFFTTQRCQGYLFAVIAVMTVFAHFVHDTVDDNFDGVRWFWPLNWNSFKFKGGRWEKQTSFELRGKIKELYKNGRTTKEILKDNF